MFLARIDGTLTASRKDHRLGGVRFLIGQRLNRRQHGRRAAGRPRPHGRGPRIDSCWCRPTGPSRATGLGKGVPARLVVVGIVDRVAPQPTVEGRAS